MRGERYEQRTVRRLQMLASTNKWKQQADWEAGNRSACNDHPEPNPSWSTLPFHLGWIDGTAFRTPMNEDQAERAAMYRRSIVKAYQGANHG